MPQRRDPVATRNKLLTAARLEFARHGFAGARVDEIAERAGVNKQLVYHYFGDKDALYLAVLEWVYADIREQERQLNLEGLPPEKAIRKLIEASFDYLAANPDFKPAFPSAHNPVLRTPPRPENRIWIEDERASACVDLANAAYALMLRLLAQAAPGRCHFAQQLADAFAGGR